jgi:Histidine kinase-, DNA gyrase B-, and HSP90-like ATPase
VRMLTRREARSHASLVATQRSKWGTSATSCARWIRAAAGGDSATVRVAVPDASGRLRVIACEGQPDGSGRLGSKRRRAVFQTERPVHLSVHGAVGVSIGIFPLVSDGNALGVIEVLAPTAMIEQRTDVLLALVGQSALVLDSLHVRTETERALAGMSSLLSLASELLWVRTAVEVVRLAVDACHDHLGVPVAGLLPDRDGWGWFLVSSNGLGARRRSQLRESVRAWSGEPGHHRMGIPSVRLKFQEISDCREVVALRAGTAVVLIGDAPQGDGEFVDGVSSLLEAILPRLGTDRARPSGAPASELGIAWTVHELKGPLVGARAALERAAEATVPEGRDLLRRTKEELGQLSDLIDPLLRWSTGTELLKRERIDLVRVTREAVATSSLGLDVDRVMIDSPSQLFILADPRQLRSAIGNVVRNALAYSPPESPVRISIEFAGRFARVRVRDCGPGIPKEERGHVFDPFNRGRAHSDARSGSGLGLFIARRVLEAHGGSISLRPSRSGSTFVLELPAEGRQLSAS